jgi:hypothetical protein
MLTSIGDVGDIIQLIGSILLIEPFEKVDFYRHLKRQKDFEVFLTYIIGGVKYNLFQIASIA